MVMEEMRVGKRVKLRVGLREKKKIQRIRQTKGNKKSNWIKRGKLAVSFTNGGPRRSVLCKQFLKCAPIT